MDEDPLYEKAKKRALRFLSYKPRSTSEVVSKLAAEGYNRKTIAKVTERLCEVRWLDDGNVARQLVNRYAVDRLWGDLKIRMALKRRGFPEDAVHEALVEARREFSEEKAVEKIIEKCFPDRLTSSEISDKEKQRLIRRLISKGFPPDTIFKTLVYPEKEEYIDYW
ncbi:MAG: recombination regulator RecX [Syntrophales bacterium]|nr:recombination regulator RecX [Syntrophales bacterium]